MTSLPTGEEYANYKFRIARVVDGAAAADHREVSIVVIPSTPGNLRGGWNLRYYPTLSPSSGTPQRAATWTTRSRSKTSRTKRG